MAWTSHDWAAPAETGDAVPSAQGTSGARGGAGAGARGAAGARAVSARRRRALARSLRQAATHTPARDGGRRRFEVLLRDRVASVRAELVELADALERHDDPDPRCVAELHRLLTDGCHSPLYNPDVHVSELWATVYYLKGLLMRSAPSSRIWPE